MKLEVSYPAGPRHIVELPEGVFRLGRDPASDLVLYDSKCSRHHAVLESTGQGIFLRDSGSAAGTFINGKRAKRARVAAGDELRLGDVAIRLVEEPPGAAAAPLHPRVEDLAYLQAQTDRSAALAEPPALAARILGLGWAAFAPIFAAIGVAAFTTVEVPAWRITALATGGVLAVWSVVMAFGWLRLARWVRPAQLISSVAGAIVCPLTVTAIVAGAYASRSDTRKALSQNPVPAPDAQALSRSDRAYALLITVCLLLSGLLLVLGTIYALSRVLLR